MDSNADKNESAEDGSSNSTSSKESSITNPDSRGDDVQIHTQETGTSDISKPGSAFEPEQLPDDRYTSVLKPDNLYQYYNFEIKRRMEKYVVDESELEDENYYDTVGEPEGEGFDQKERKADEKVTKHNVVIQRDKMNKVLGKLWGDTDEVIKSGVLKTITKEKRYLLEKKFEIIASEASYLKSINVLIDVFMMSDMFRYKSPTRSKVNKQKHDLIFSNILEIRETSERFLQELESNWESNIFLSDVCKIVADHAEQKFECYVAYCSTQHVQSRTIQELRQNSGDFDKALKQLEERPECQRMDMLSFLLLPMQRITRLRLLTNDVYKKIAEKENKDDVRKEANRVHRYVSKVNKRCNRAALMKQGEDDMKRVAKTIAFSDKKIEKIQIEEKSRYLVREKEVIRLGFGKGGKAQLESLYLYIFSDLAVFTKKKKMKGSRQVYTVLDHCKLLALKAENIVDIRDEKYKKMLPSDIPEGHEKFLLRLIILENHNKKSVEWILSCKDKTEKDNWMEIIAPIAGFEDDEKIYTDLDFPLVQCIEKYTAQDDEELSLDESDEVRVTKKDERSGMYYGERLKDQEEGWFPKNHTKEIDDEHVLQRNHLMRYLLKHDYGEDE
ncbi:ephexin-1-like [Mercenaria mercenaria]|uniref:ephexin-1-like n=1 Tax=Mercenaria mercenaria TaxID=6596 RepID=UPI00234E7D2D|nr:ephexin-1-like [Mercenaria mercenaria]